MSGQSDNIASPSTYTASSVSRDLVAGVVVFLVALPLCLGIALASGAPPISGLIAGIIGGIIVGAISGSHTSVSGPAAGLAAIVVAQLNILGSFDAFLLAVVLAGLLQIGLGIARAGSLSAFFPTSVIKGLLSAIGVLLILKQLPHVFGDDNDPEGEMAFFQPDGENTFSELFTALVSNYHLGAAFVGVSSVVILVVWNRLPYLKAIPAALVVVAYGIGMQVLFENVDGMLDSVFGGNASEVLSIQGKHLVSIPPPEDGIMSYVTLPDFSALSNPGVYFAAVTIAIVASLETLLNLEAVDKLDPQQRNSPSSRELVAQGVGNTVSGLIGGLPITSVIVRSSVNVGIGAKSKLSAVFHGFLLVFSVLLFPALLNRIPLAALAAILLVTGFRLASPKLFKQMWSQGRYQFAPFIITLVAIVMTDLLIGVIIGLFVSLLFILNSSLRTPVRRVVETKTTGDVLHIELANQVSFLNRAALMQILDKASSGAELLIDASDSDYIDPDILGLIREFKEKTAPARGVKVRLSGFREKYNLKNDPGSDDQTYDAFKNISPLEALLILQEGNRRFRTGQLLNRKFDRRAVEIAQNRAPIAAVLTCSDLRVAPDMLFDMGFGDLFNVSVAGNVVGKKSLGSLEYAVRAELPKLLVVLGHTPCRSVDASVHALAVESLGEQLSGDSNESTIVNEVLECVSHEQCREIDELPAAERKERLAELVHASVERTVLAITERSQVIREAVDNGNLLVVGAVYDVTSGVIEFRGIPKQHSAG
jgi:carbonic anhydrase/SulP family sulfate permease